VACGAAPNPESRHWDERMLTRSCLRLIALLVLSRPPLDDGAGDSRSAESRRYSGPRRLAAPPAVDRREGADLIAANALLELTYTAHDLNSPWRKSPFGE
jgi:hypothetical protein